MARIKADARIGYRAAEEAYRLSNYSTCYAALLIGCDRKAVNSWVYGIAPSAIYLQRLAEMGADVGYILIDRRIS